MERADQVATQTSRWERILLTTAVSSEGRRSHQARRNVRGDGLIGYAITRLNASPQLLLVLLTGAILLLLLPFDAQRRFDPFEPIVVFALAFGIMFVLRPLVMLMEHTIVYERPTGVTAVSDGSPNGVLAAAGAAAFVCAYALPLGKR